VKPILHNDLRRLATLAFKRKQRCGPLVKQLWTLRRQIEQLPNSAHVWNIYSWLLVPLSLWPVDFEGLANHVVQTLKESKPLGEELDFFLELIDRPPSEQTQAAVGQFEHNIEAGSYDRLLLHPEKFEESEAELKHDPELLKAWKQLTNKFHVGTFQNPRGVIRRRMSQERNLREGWEFEWKDDRGRFLVLFDAFCHRWKLYGMQHDTPLLLKVSVNPTPHGTLIMIPRHISLDPSRDLDWKTIGKLHRSHGVRRQGPAFSKGRMDKRHDALRAKRLWDQAGKKGLTGEARSASVAKQMGRAQGDYTWLKRLLAHARKLPDSNLQS
jgi:hypothetical protein